MNKSSRNGLMSTLSLAAALLTPLLLPHIGWRGMFAVGVLPAFAAWIIRSKLHEPEVFVRKEKKGKKAKKGEGETDAEPKAEAAAEDREGEAKKARKPRAKKAAKKDDAE